MSAPLFIPVTLPLEIRKINSRITKPAVSGYPDLCRVHEESGADAHKLDYKNGAYCITTIPAPEPGNESIMAGGTTECVLTGWAKRAIMSTRGFPAPVEYPPSVRYVVREARGKGLGAFATDNMRAGTLIFAERPLLVLPVWWRALYGGVVTKEQMQQVSQAERHADDERQIELLCSRMEPENARKYRRLSNCHKTDELGPLHGIQQTNGFAIGLDDPAGAQIMGPGLNRYSCVGAEAARLNHSCTPNASLLFNMQSFAIEIYAVRPIAKGEELTLTYGAEDLNTAARQTHFKQSYGFICSCSACANPRLSDVERAFVMHAPLPEMSAGPAHAESVLARYEATGLQGRERYLDLLSRVAEIQREAGNRVRADELEGLAIRLLAIFCGRNFVRENIRLFSYDEDLMKENKGSSSLPCHDECAPKLREHKKQKPARSALKKVLGPSN